MDQRREKRVESTPSAAELQAVEGGNPILGKERLEIRERIDLEEG
jgi:hypothetical protein